MNANLFFKNLTQVSMLPGSFDPQFLHLSPNMAARNICDFLQRLYEKNPNSLLSEISERKKIFMELISGSKTCLFQKITLQNWEKIFFENITKNQTGENKTVAIWGHVFTSNTWHRSDNGWKCGNTSFFFDHFEDLMIEIGGEKYHYGERVIITQQDNPSTEGYVLGVNIPVIVLDERMIQKMKGISNAPEVLEKIRLIFMLTSNQALIQNFFQEQDLMAGNGEEMTLEGKLKNTAALTQNQYPLNFKRLQKVIMVDAKKSNPLLETAISEMIQTIQTLTRDWDETLKQYIHFIMWERILLIDPNKFFFEKISHLNQFLGIEQGGEYAIHPIGSIVYDMVHTGGNEGIIFNVQKGEISGNFSFAEMARITAKHVLKFQTEKVHEPVEE